jgi:hypothetical protein
MLPEIDETVNVPAGGFAPPVKLFNELPCIVTLTP